MRLLRLATAVTTAALVSAAVAVTPTAPAVAGPEDIARIKTVTGTASVKRQDQAQALPAAQGLALRQTDIVETGPDGSVGITFTDNSMMSLGPATTLSLDTYQFNATTHEGTFDTSLKQGTLAVKSGKIAGQTPEAMRIRTASSILGVRGTEFVVRAENE